jgi:hypothetical protein
VNLTVPAEAAMDGRDLRSVNLRHVTRVAAGQSG